MKTIQFNLSALWNSLRLVVAACACALILLSNATPAYSFPNPFAPDKAAQPSSPTKGEDKLQTIEEGAQKTVNRSQDLLSGEEVTKKSNEGINEVQGSADADKMKSPLNSPSESVEETLKNKLEGAAGKK